MQAAPTTERANPNRPDKLLENQPHDPDPAAHLGQV